MTKPASLLFPTVYDRDYEERLLAFCARPTFAARQWAAVGPAFFMAGVAVMLASVTGYDRKRLLMLAERLYKGSSEVPTFTKWLKQSPCRPSRFLPMLAQRIRHAA